MVLPSAIVSFPDSHSPAFLECIEPENEAEEVGTYLMSLSIVGVEGRFLVGYSSHLEGWNKDVYLNIV